MDMGSALLTCLKSIEIPLLVIREMIITLMCKSTTRVSSGYPWSRVNCRGKTTL